MSLSTNRPTKLFLLFVAVAAAATTLVFLPTTVPSYEDDLASAGDKLSGWNLSGAESVLSDLVAQYPDSVLVRRMYAECLLKRGELRLAHREYEILLRTDHAGHPQHLLSVATVHYYLGNLDSTEMLARRVLDVADDAGALHAAALNLAGRVAFNRARYDSAMALQTLSLAFARRSSAKQQEADALRQLGVLHWYAGRDDSARFACYAPALSLYREINDKIGEATTLNNVALAGGGQHYYLEAFALRRKIGDQIGIADSYYFIAPGRSDRWLDLAFKLYRKSVQLSDRIGYSWGKEVALRALEQLLFVQYDSLQYSSDDLDALGHASAEGVILRLLLESSNHVRKGEWGKAAALRERAVRLCDSTGYATGLKAALSLYAEALIHLGETEAAYDAVRRLRAIAPDNRYDTDMLLAQTHRARKDPAAAYHVLSEALHHLDGEYSDKLGRTNPWFGAGLGQLLKKRYALFDMLLTCIEPQNGSDLLFETLERFKALPVSTALEFGGAENDGSLWHRYLQTIEAIDVSPDSIDLFMDQFRAAYTQAVERSERMAGAANLMKRSKSKRMRDVQQAMRPGQLALGYFVGASDAYILAVSEERGEMIKLTGVTQSIRSASSALHELILRGRVFPDDRLWKGPARFLFRTLVQPALDLHGGAGVSELILCPQGPLQNLPFAILIDSSGTLLVERVTVSYVSSIGDARTVDRHRLPTDFIAFVPDESSLPFTGKEVANLPEHLFTTQTLLVGRHATGEKFLAANHRSTFIHFAAHGEVNRRYPTLSAILLSDGPLELYRIFKMNMQFSIVVLSACESGYGVGSMGDVAHGHELVSFPHAFLFADASAVMATHWLVEDESTSRLMQSLYRHLARLKASGTSQPLGTALASAQRSFLAESKASKSHPFYWAGFYLLEKGR